MMPAAVPLPDPPIRLLAFGPLRVLRDGQPLDGDSGKAPRKLQDLLALLAAHAGGPLRVPLVIDELWPSLDANAPRASFDMAVSRLRRLLGSAAAVRCNGERIALDPAIVWVDVAAFEALATRAEAGDLAACQQAVALHTDALLGGGPLPARLLARRQALGQRLIGLVLSGAPRLQAEGERAAAAQLLQRALACEPLCEPLHRALMELHLAAGERAEALRVYQRCQALLSAALGARPAPATEHLAAAARRPAPATPREQVVSTVPRRDAPGVRPQ